jgi:energy-coupling factor transporter ATP-binding protein EcfA2
MPKLYHLHIENFRGLQTFDHTFTDGLTCIIGRGDSGKSTILEALSLVFTSSYSVLFQDGDFYNCDVENPIVMQATVIAPPDKIMSKFGNYVRGITQNGDISDDNMDSDEAVGYTPAMTIQLKVDRSLEPEWTMFTTREIQPAHLNGTDRAMFNCFYISDYSDRHFSLAKGTPLYALFSQMRNGDDDELIEALELAKIGREAKENFDNAIGDKFKLILDQIIEQSKLIGLDVSEIKTSIDQREVLLRENKISLHDGKKPLRLSGKGSKRLVSLAIQLSLTNPSGIILIDEIEQGLEPDRVQHLVNMLKTRSNIQVILTTHSRDVITELPCSCLFIKRSWENGLLNITTDLQGCVRANPEAFFAKRIIVCEGATEIGFIRAIDQYRQENYKKSMSYLGVRYANGTGNSLVNYALAFKKLGYDTCLVCDSDDKSVNPKKGNVRNNNIPIFDCDSDCSLEQQIFTDVSWGIVKELIEYHKQINGKDDSSVFSSVIEHIQNKFEYTTSWLDVETAELRAAIGLSAKGGEKKRSDKAWYKRTDHGFDIGSIILRKYNDLPDKRLKSNIDGINEWIDKA